MKFKLYHAMGHQQFSLWKFEKHSCYFFWYLCPGWPDLPQKYSSGCRQKVKAVHIGRNIERICSKK